MNGDRLPARPAGVHRRLRAAGRDEAVRRPRRSTTSASASPEDRRYLLFNPMTKMKVTTEGERVIDQLWDVIAAKGFEQDMFFEMAARDIRGAAEARGHGPREHGARPEVHGRLPVQRRSRATPPCRRASSSAGDDEFLFRQGPARGLGKIRFADWRAAYSRPFATSRTSRASPSRPSRFKQLLVDAAAGRGAAEGPRLPADPRRAVHAGRLRAADLRAGGARRPAGRHARPDLRRAGARLLRLRRRSCTARRRRPRPRPSGRGRRSPARWSTPSASSRSGRRSARLAGQYEMRP